MQTGHQSSMKKKKQSKRYNGTKNTKTNQIPTRPKKTEEKNPNGANCDWSACVLRKTNKLKQQKTKQNKTIHKSVRLF